MKGTATRRSSRTLRQNENTPNSNSGRSRSLSANESRKRSASKVNEAETSRKRKRSLSSSPLEKQKVPKRIVDGRIMDSFCWVCHRLVPSDPNSSSECLFCPRVYHKECLKKLKFGSNSHSKCECQLKSVDGKNENLKLDPRELKKMLQSVMQEAIKEDKKTKSYTIDKSKLWQLFRTWPENEDNDSLCKIMDLTILIDNMNGEDPYLSTGQFYADVKWIYHNCCILYGFDCDISETALKLEKNFKLELTDMEGCTECYQNKYADDYLYSDYFTKVCSSPHTIIWAKLRGSPFWPAKCLKVQNGHVEVRFFGTHDKSNIMINKCFLMSAKAPNNRQITQPKYQDAMQELKIYICNYEKVFGKTFHYYPCNTPLGKGSASPKKGNRKGRRKSVGRAVLNESVSGFQGTVDSAAELSNVERKMTQPFQYTQKNIDSSQTLTESTRDVDVNSDTVYHMTFTADEHNVPASELNNPDEFVENSALHFPLDSMHPLPSLSETSLSTSNLYEASPDPVQNQVNLQTSSTADTETSLNSLPIITSAASNSSSEIDSNISAESNASSPLPVITATMSTCPDTEYPSSSISAQRENVELPVNGEHNSLLLQSVHNEHLANLMNAASSFHCLFDGEDDDCRIITEADPTKEEKGKRYSPGMSKTFLELVFSQYPAMKKQFMKATEVFSETFLAAFFQARTGQDMHINDTYLDLFRKTFKKMDTLIRINSEAEEKIKELQDKVNKLERVSNQKNVLKNCIIKVASQKMQRRNDENEENKDDAERIRVLQRKLERCRNSELRAIEEKETLYFLLRETRERMALKEQELALTKANFEVARKALDKDKSKPCTVTGRGVQTESIYLKSPDKENKNASVHTAGQDSSQVLQNRTETSEYENLTEIVETQRLTTTIFQSQRVDNENTVEDQPEYEENPYTLEPMYINPPIRMTIPSPSQGLFMASPSSGLMLPSLSSGMIRPNPSSGMIRPNLSSGMIRPNLSSGMAYSNPSSSITFPNSSSGLFVDPSQGIAFPNQSPGMMLPAPSLLSVVMNPASSSHQNPFLNTESSSFAGRVGQSVPNCSVGNPAKSNGKRKKK